MIARPRLSQLAWPVLGALASACSFDASVDAAPSICIQGASVACECANGTLGAQVCQADGIFGTCQCGEPPAGGAGGAGQPVGGSGGADLGDDTDDGVSAGSDGSPVMEVDASEPPSLSGGSGGMSGSDDAGIIPSSGGAGGITGAAGDSASGAMGPKEGEAYGPCRADSTCDLPMFCMFGVERYCAPLCSGNGRDNDNGWNNGNGPGVLSCPPHPDGSPTFCVRNVCTRL